MKTAWLLLLVASMALATACSDSSGGSKTVNNTSSPNNDADVGNTDIGDNNNDSCEEGEESCDGACVDTTTSDEHCGACGSVCEGGPNTTASCNGGSCEVSCEAGYNDPNGDKDDPNGDGCTPGCTETNGGIELCDGEDNDCDGSIDEDFATLGDDCNVGQGICASSGELVCNTDGSDVECSATEGTPENEVCGDSLDNDCDGEVDESDATDAKTWYEDADADGYGVTSTTTTQCDPPTGYVEQDGDCADDDDAINPGVSEVCDGIDNNCDGTADDGLPTATYYFDQDGDGYGNDSISQTDCQQPTGYVVDGGDCDDANSQRYPGANETCDGVDDNCDGSIDETFANKGQSCTAGQGVCQNSGTYVCTSDGSGTECSASAGQPQEAAEATCDSLDNDCDGSADEGCDDDADGYCDSSFTVTANATVCNNGSQTGDCDDDDDTIYPDAPGLCDNKDNDCDGSTDELQLINTSPTSFSMTAGDSTIGNFPPPALAAPADDGFCIIAFDNTNNIIEMGYMKPDGTQASRTASNQADVDLMDIAWNGSNCGAIVRYSGNLLFLEWDTSATTVGSIFATSNLLTTNDGNVFNAALRPYQSCNQFLCTTRWQIAYITDSSSSPLHKLVYVTTKDKPNLFQDSPSPEVVVSTTVDSNTDVDLGPSPNSGDEFAVTWRDGSTIKVATASSIGGSESFHSNLYVNNASNYRYPTLTDINGTVYLVYANSANGSKVIKEMTSNYQYDLTKTISGSGLNEYISRYPLAEGIDNKFGWFMQPYSDLLYTLQDTRCDTWGRPVLYPLGNPCIYSREVTNANKGVGDDLMAVNTEGDIMQVLRLAYPIPYRFEIDEFTCY